VRWPWPKRGAPGSSHAAPRERIADVDATAKLKCSGTRPQGQPEWLVIGSATASPALSSPSASPPPAQSGQQAGGADPDPDTVFHLQAQSHHLHHHDVFPTHDPWAVADGSGLSLLSSLSLRPGAARPSDMLNNLSGSGVILSGKDRPVRAAVRALTAGDGDSPPTAHH